MGNPEILHIAEVYTYMYICIYAGHIVAGPTVFLLHEKSFVRYETV